MNLIEKRLNYIIKYEPKKKDISKLFKQISKMKKRIQNL